MSAPKLRRCPACGKRKALRVAAPECAPSVECVRQYGGCGASGPFGYTAGGWTEADAIAAWNALPRRPKRRKAERAVANLALASRRCPLDSIEECRVCTHNRRRVLRLMGIDDARDGGGEGEDRG